jgi:HJR/Mrr/RecB family endonuclease
MKKKTAIPQGVAEAGPQAAGSMSFCDAAEVILRREGKPLNHRQLARKAIEERLVHSESETPEISMHVSIRSEMKRRDLRAEPQRFAFLGNGLFSLVELFTGAPKKKTKTAIDQVKESRKEACDDLFRKLTSSNQGANFETMVADLLVQMGYQNVEVIGGKDDQGVDITCEKRDGVLKTRVAIQCKCRNLNKKIGPKDVSTLRDNLSTYQCQQAILVTTSELNESAKSKAKEAGKEPVHYIEHDEILDLFAEYKIGLRSEQVKYYQVDASQYEFLRNKGD